MLTTPMQQDNSSDRQSSYSVQIYCDGACSHNPGIGGWGAVLLWKQQVKEIYGYEKKTTNNRMELCAAINALKVIKKATHIDVYTDSMYLKNGITQWIHSWKHNNWKQGKVKNIDLWKELDTLSNAMNITWHWIKGHADNEYNNRADYLAKNAICEYHRKLCDSE